MNDYFDLFAEIDKQLAKDYPSPEPVGHHFCSQCGVIHSDSKHIEKESHWVRGNDGEWKEKSNG